MRFTLSNLFLGVAMIALACAGVTIHNRFWMDGLVTMSLLLYVVMAIRAVGLCGPERAFAIAFAVTGAGYLILAILSAFFAVPDLLVTNLLLAVAARHAFGFGQQFTTEGIAESSWNALNNFETLRLDYGQFFAIGHCVLSWLFALIGGWIVARMFRKRERTVSTA